MSIGPDKINNPDQKKPSQVINDYGCRSEATKLDLEIFAHNLKSNKGRALITI
jgi:hypothetical protein